MQYFNKTILGGYSVTTIAITRRLEYVRFFFSTIASTDAGKVWLSNEWKLCTALKTDADTQALIDWLTEIYGNLAMVNYPYPTNFLAPLPGYPVRVLCSHLTNMTLQEKDLIHTLVEAVSIYTNYTGKTKCNDVSQASPGLNANMWEFQVREDKNT